MISAALKLKRSLQWLVVLKTDRNDGLYNTSNTHDQDKFCHHHIGDHSALDTGQGQIAFSPTFSLKMGSQF